MLTEIQRFAIANARRGDFALLDAMELDHRIRTGQCHVGFLQGGRLRLFGQVAGGLGCFECGGEGSFTCMDCAGKAIVECPDCEGRKQLDCLDCDGKGCAACDAGKVPCEECDGVGNIDCEECSGAGRLDCDDCGGAGELHFDDMTAEVTITDFDGRVVWRSDSDSDSHDPSDGMEARDRAWAGSILSNYHKALREAAEAAAEAAKPPRGQQSLIPETH